MKKYPIKEKPFIETLLELQRRGYRVTEQLAYCLRSKGFVNHRFINPIMKYTEED
jgi:hypothetical protein